MVTDFSIQYHTKRGVCSLEHIRTLYKIRMNTHSMLLYQYVAKIMCWLQMSQDCRGWQTNYFLIGRKWKRNTCQILFYPETLLSTQNLQGQNNYYVKYPCLSANLISGSGSEFPEQTMSFPIDIPIDIKLTWIILHVVHSLVHFEYSEICYPCWFQGPKSSR